MANLRGERQRAKPKRKEEAGLVPASHVFISPGMGSPVFVSHGLMARTVSEHDNVPVDRIWSGCRTPQHLYRNVEFQQPEPIRKISDFGELEMRVCGGTSCGECKAEGRSPYRTYLPQSRQWRRSQGHNVHLEPHEVAIVAASRIVSIVRRLHLARRIAMPANGVQTWSLKVLQGYTLRCFLDTEVTADYCESDR